MVTLTDEYTVLMFKAIEQREGTTMAQAHAAEKTADELENYFSAHYVTFSADVPPTILIEHALEMMDYKTFIDMQRNYAFTDVLECLMREGYVSQVLGQWVVSVDKPKIEQF